MTRQQDSVGLTTFDTEIRLDMPARSSPRHFNEMMQQLEAIKPGGETDVAETLHKLANRFKRRCLIVLISDLYDEPEEVMRALHHFRHRRHEVIVFHVFDKAEIEFPFRDVIAFHDLETNERIQVDPAYVRDAYMEQIEAVHRDLPPGLRRGADRLRDDRHLGALRFHAFQATSPSGTAHDLRRAAVPAGRAGRRDPGGAAHDQPAEGEGPAVSHAAVPADQRAEDAAAEADPRPAADAAPGGRAAADRLGLARPTVTNLEPLLGGGAARPWPSCSTTRPAWA